MKFTHNSARVSTIIMLSALPLLGQTEQRSEKRIEQTQSTTHAAEYMHKQIVYRPPSRGVPSGRVSAGTRGPSQEAIVLSLLTPDHVGLTTQRQPSLYWYLSTREIVPIVVTLSDERGIMPLAEIELDHPKQPGVQRFSLADHGIQLEPNVDYEWSVTLIMDPEHRSKDIYAKGGIRCVEASGQLSAKLKNAAAFDAPFIYAEEGLWYDAMHELSALIAAHPQNIGLRQQRAALLKQVELAEIAALDHFAD